MSTATDIPKKKSKKVRSTEPNVVDEPALASSPEPSKKRKRDTTQAEELEVDVTLPEPLSKADARRAKKSKPLRSSSSKTKAEADSDDDLHPPNTSASTEEAKRSDFGIWIGNLAWTTTKPMLNDFFLESASLTQDDITRINMPVPYKTPATKTTLKPQNKGFAYVDFATSSALAAALALSETTLGGRAVLIKNAKSFEGRPEKKQGVDEVAGPGAKPISQKPVSKRVFVGNLSFDVTKEDLSGHFNKAGKVVDLHMATFEDSGKCKGFAWVTFEETDAAEAAVRGWTRVPVKGEEADEEDSGDEEEADGKKEGKGKKQKSRKWFINKLHGRPLRCEFAEDAQSRYKKRFGKEDKDGQVPRGGRDSTDAGAGARGGPQEKAKRDGRKKKREAVGDIAPGAPTDFSKRRGRTVQPSKEEAYKTGAITEGQGVKVTFD